MNKVAKVGIGLTAGGILAFFGWKLYTKKKTASPAEIASATALLAWKRGPYDGDAGVTIGNNAFIFYPTGEVAFADWIQGGAAWKGRVLSSTSFELTSSSTGDTVTWTAA